MIDARKPDPKRTARRPETASRAAAARTPMNPLVSKVHGGEQRWREEFAALRALCLGAGLNEELKWGQACYDLEGANVVLIHGFKEYCALLFMKGALLADPQGMLVQQTRNVQAARQLRFTSRVDIDRRAAAIRKYIDAAVAVERSGAKVRLKTAAEFDVPQEFQARLDDDSRLADAFRGLTPGRQKAYLLHFGGAKRAETRASRVAQHVPRILKGLGLDD
jgi:uncharacterized protein YdeI (YjbR/CyaY-like superfamily)